MKLVKCENCNYSIPTILNVNSRVVFCRREEDENRVEIVCKLGVYCPTCGKEVEFSIRHIFSKHSSSFAELSDHHLRDIALCESGII